MKKKFIVWLGILCLCYSDMLAQRIINEKITPRSGQNIKFYFKYPELVKVTTWDKGEIEITGKVRINNGRNDDAFALEVENEGEVLFISSTIKDLENLPKMMMIKRGDSKYYFDSTEEHDKAMQQFREEHGQNSYTYSSHGVIKEISLEVKIPANAPFTIESKFGMLEMANISAPVKAISKFGGIDMSLPQNSRKNFELSTKFGEVYTDLDLDIEKGGESKPYKWNTIYSKLNGGGKMCQLESKFGNIYLRKSQ